MKIHKETRAVLDFLVFGFSAPSAEKPNTNDRNVPERTQAECASNAVRLHGSGAFVKWERYCKGTAFAFTTLHRYLAIMECNDLFDHIQANPHSLNLLCFHVCGAVELL